MGRSPDASASQKICEYRLPVQAAHAIHMPFGAAPAAYREFKLLHRARYVPAQNAQAQNTHKKINPVQYRRLLPQALQRLGFKQGKVPRVANQRMAYKLGHLHAHTSVIEAHDRQVGAHITLQQGVDTGTHIEQGLECRLFVKKLLRWHPHNGVFSACCAALPHINLSLGQMLLQSRQQGRGIDLCAKTNTHVKNRSGNYKKSCKWCPSLGGNFRKTGESRPLSRPGTTQCLHWFLHHLTSW